MSKYRWGILLLSLIIIFSFGCSSNKNNTPVAPAGDNTPAADVPDNGHMIWSQGTFEIDPSTMEIRDVTDRVEAFHYNISGLIRNYFKYSIVAFNPPNVTIKLEIENPTDLQVHDVRIIYTNLYTKSVVNPDGYTNLYDPPGGLPFNPFHYFAKEYPNHAFPVGPGGKDSEILELYWPNGAPWYVTYVIECSLGGNAGEPYKIANLQKNGVITPNGGSMILGVDVSDWQNNISKVTILANEFYSQDVQMYPFRGTNTYFGNLTNLRGVTPGDHTIYIKAESTDGGSVALLMPFTINVPNSTDNAPKFNYVPYSTQEKISKGIYTYLNGAAVDIEGDNLNYLWEQISPASPAGIFSGTGGATASSAKWEPPQVPQDTLYLFRISATEAHGSLQSSKGLAVLTNDMPLPPMITNGPVIVPDPVNEGNIAQFFVTAEDANGSENTLTYFWEQISPSSPTGTWVGTSGGNGDHPAWQAPSVAADTEITFRVSITKGWVTPPLVTQQELSFHVKNVN